MTERELRKLTRVELLEMLLTLSRENEEMAARIRQLEEVQRQRAITLESAGSIAQAALELGGVFEAAQRSAELFLLSIREKEQAAQELCAQRVAECEANARNIEREAQHMMEQTQTLCDEMLAQARRRAGETADAAGEETKTAEGDGENG